MQSPTSTPTPLQRHASQQAEYEALLTALSAVQTASSEISGYYMPPQADSPLGIEHNHAQALLLALFEDAGDKVLSEHLRPIEGLLTEVNGVADQCVFSTTRKDGSVALHRINDVTDSASAIRAFQRALVSIGGYIRTDRLLPLPQCLKFYGLTLPAANNTESLTRLIEEVQEKRAIHRLNLEQGLQISELIEPHHPPLILNVISEIVTTEASSVIDTLANDVTPPITPQQLNTQPTACLERLLDTPKAQNVARRLLETLDWYGGEPDEETVPDIGAKLLLEALRLWYDLTHTDAPHSIAGYSLQQRGNHGKSYADILESFRQHLKDSHYAITPTERALLGRLGQAGFPVEFQVRDIPHDLPYATSIVWVNFVHGAHLAHALDPTLLQRLTFQQLTDLPLKKSENATDALLQLIALTRIPAALTWTQATGVLAHSAQTSDSRESKMEALKALEDHTRQLNDAIVQLDTAPPQRLKLAEQQLKVALTNDISIDPLSIRLMRDLYRSGRRVERGILDTPVVPQATWPLLEVYASGGLKPGSKWYISRDGKTASFWIRLSADRKFESGLANPDTPASRILLLQHNRTLPDIDELFDKQFKSYLDETKKAYEVLIKSLLVTLPWADRKVLEHGEVRILSLRDETGRKADEETAAHTLPLRARMGFVLQAAYGKDVLFYECLPRAGVIRPRTDVTTAHVGGVRDKFFFVNRWAEEDYDFYIAIRPHRLPFDRDAHTSGTPPRAGTTCRAILDPLGNALPPTPTPPAHHDYSPNFTLTSPRTQQIASFIATQLFFLDEQELRREARGTTQYERDLDEKHWINNLKGFVPFWGSLEDLQSDQFGDRVLGVIGLALDIVSFVMPLGKFAAGSIRLAARAGRMGIRATLPRMADLSRILVTSSLKNLNPLDGASDLLRLIGRGVKGAGRAAVHLERRAMFQLKKLAGKADSYDFVSSLPQATEPGRWKPLMNADQLGVVKGIEDVPLRKIDGHHYLIDPLSTRPYGPRLTALDHELSLGRSSYNRVNKTDDLILFELPDQAHVRYQFDIDGRTTAFIDDAPYRLDGEDLRRVEMIDDSGALTSVPCRPRRAPDNGSECRSSFVTGTPAPTPEVGSFDETKGYAPWFGDRMSEAVIRPGHNGQFVTHEGNLYQVIDNKPTLYPGDITELGFARKWLVPRREMPANLMFRKGIYGRIEVKGVYEGAEDPHQIGAILVPSIDESSTYVFSRINTDKYYVATVPKGQNLSEPLTLKRLFKADMAEDTLGAELLTVYTGSLSANNIARIHGEEALELAMKTMDEIAIPIGAAPNPPGNMKFLKVDTSPGEALMFDHATRMIVTRMPEGATTWSRSKDAPEDLRQSTANIFDALFMEPTIDASNANSALRINQTMQKLHQLIPRRQRSFNPRNIAYADVMTSSGQREIYVSVSGAQQATDHLPLFKQHLGADSVQVGESTYFNIDMNQRFPYTSLDMTAEGKLLAVPTTIKDIGTYKPAQSKKPTSLDSESKLIRVIREKYPDPKAIKSVNIATTMPPCESCSIVMKEFGYDGGENALQVLWS
ncbi:deaminase domain-containing protein [Pseudomonas sp. GNP012]